jgi:hypothetical protein
VIEKWIRKDFFNNFTIDSVFDFDCIFRVTLINSKNTKSKIIISFENMVYSYSNLSKDFRLEKIKELEEVHGKDFFREGAFFKVLGSAYSKWLIKNSNGLAMEYDLAYFAIVDSKIFLEILTTGEPKVTEIKLKQ